MKLAIKKDKRANKNKNPVGTLCDITKSRQILTHSHAIVHSFIHGKTHPLHLLDNLKCNFIINYYYY